ncbi:hypothetical protein BC628DRAFT_128964 [Trametes gibbosa]|nr:hypothetical protein BC628DRAFT_128964 [Trametes gibbosa]
MDRWHKLAPRRIWHRSAVIHHSPTHLPSIKGSPEYHSAHINGRSSSSTHKEVEHILVACIPRGLVRWPARQYVMTPHTPTICHPIEERWSPATPSTFWTVLLQMRFDSAHGWFVRCASAASAGRVTSGARSARTQRIAPATLEAFSKRHPLMRSGARGLA